MHQINISWNSHKIREFISWCKKLHERRGGAIWYHFLWTFSTESRLSQIQFTHIYTLNGHTLSHNLSKVFHLLQYPPWSALITPISPWCFLNFSLNIFLLSSFSCQLKQNPTNHPFPQKHFHEPVIKN